MAGKAFETSRNSNESQRHLPRQQTRHWAEKTYSVLRKEQQVKAAMNLESFSIQRSSSQRLFPFLILIQTPQGSCSRFTPGEVVVGIHEPTQERPRTKECISAWLPPPWETFFQHIKNSLILLPHQTLALSKGMNFGPASLSAELMFPMTNTHPPYQRCACNSNGPGSKTNLTTFSITWEVFRFLLLWKMKMVKWNKICCWGITKQTHSLSPAAP